jgi:hypothetical protein
MRTPDDLPRLIEAAEHAAAGGDYASAALRLREAAAVQEGQLGPRHPDLAHTLNNLAVASERAGEMREAEAAYRRAYDLARAVLDPDHPFVATSEANLREFCEARGLPFEAPAPAPPDPPAAHGPSTAVGPQIPAPLATPAPSSAAPPEPAFAAQPAQTTIRPAARPVAARERRSVPAGVILLGVLAAGGLVFAWLSSPPVQETSDQAPASPAAMASGPAGGPGAVPPASSPAGSASPGPAAAGASSRPAEPSGASAPPRGDDGQRGAAVSVERAAMCRALSPRASSAADWPCTSAGAAVAPGTLFFYTRIRSARPTSVEHRWYRDGALQQRVELRVAANPQTGYRTYSRLTIASDQDGPWRVELRGATGAVLHEERFVVR